MRLQPIEKPKGLGMRFAYFMTRRRLGKVLTPMKVVTARMPGSLRMTYEIQRYELTGVRLDPTLHYLVATFTSWINGCSFCQDLGRAMAMREHLPMEAFAALPEYRTSPLFTASQKAALAYVEEATRYKRVSDATFASLCEHFEAWQIAEITWLNALENYYNLINLPLEIDSDGFCALGSDGPPGERRSSTK